MTKARNIADLGSNDVLETSSTGVEVTGDVSLGDNGKVKLGTGDDLQIYHDGSNSYVKDTGTGDLYLQGSSAVQIEDASGTNMIYALSGDTVQLFHNGSNKLATTATGVDVTGTVTADGLTVDGQGTFTTSDNSAQVTLISTDTDALVGPKLNLWRNSGVGSNGDLIGEITFTGEDTVASTNTFATISAIAEQASNGSEDGSLHIKTLLNGTLANRLSIGSASSGGDVYFYEDTGTTAKMVWSSSAESLGIGGTPSTILDVIGEAPTLTLRDSRAGGTWSAGTALGKLDFYTSDGTGIGAHSIASIGVVAGGANTASPDGHLVFSTGAYNSLSTERARIDSSGGFRINTTSTAYGSAEFLSIIPSGGQHAGIGIKTGDSGGYCLGLWNTTSSGYYARFAQGSGTSVGSITHNTSSTYYNTTSDERLKENIQDTTHSVDINDIQVREFDWKADGSHQRYGFIAQELETVYPEAVHSPEDADEMKSVDYSKLMPLLTKALQEALAKIEQLETRIETLENN